MYPQSVIDLAIAAGEVVYEGKLIRREDVEPKKPSKGAAPAAEKVEEAEDE